MGPREDSEVHTTVVIPGIPLYTDAQMEHGVGNFLTSIFLTVFKIVFGFSPAFGIDWKNQQEIYGGQRGSPFEIYPPLIKHGWLENPPC